jgi:bifunctional UDP-N-acetylglucosamine pyrophosphorylase / glucosamine-1-phosphate N-acetyltransferase
MRSERPKPLHRLCGRPMLMYVLESLTDGPGATRGDRRGPQGRLGDQEDAGARARRRSSSSSSRCSAAPATRRSWASSGLPDEDDDGDVLVLPGDARCCALDDRRAGRHHRSTGAAATVLTRRHGRPDRLRTGRAWQGRTGCTASPSTATPARRARDHRGQHLDLLLPAQPARAGAAAHRARQRPGRVLPDRRDRGARRRRAPGRGGRRRGRCGDPGINDRLQLAAAEAELRRRTNETLLRSGVTMVDPAAVLRGHHGRRSARRHALPRRHAAGRTVVGDGTELGPNTRLVDTVVGSDCVVEQTTARNAASATAASSVPTPRSAPGPNSRRTRPPGRSTLRTPGSDATASLSGRRRREAHGGAGHQEAD